VSKTKKLAINRNEVMRHTERSDQTRLMEGDEAQTLPGEGGSPWGHSGGLVADPRCAPRGPPPHVISSALVHTLATACKTHLLDQKTNRRYQQPEPIMQRERERDTICLKYEGWGVGGGGGDQIHWLAGPLLMRRKPQIMQMNVLCRNKLYSLYIVHAGY